MEQNFQTSFIPKKPIIEESNVKEKKSMGFFLLLSIIIFLSISLFYFAIFLYGESLDSKIVKNKESIKRFKDSFEISVIETLEVLDKRLIASTKILEKHITVSPIFKILQEITMKSVSYTKFSYQISEKDEVVIKMSGKAESYKSIALQSDLFSNNKNLIEPVFSNLTLDEKGNVLFDLEFKVDPVLVNYKHTLDKERNIAVPVENNNIIINNPN